MKKLLPISLGLLLAVSLAACTDGGTTGGSSAPSSEPSSSAPSEPASSELESSEPGSSEGEAPEGTELAVGGIITDASMNTITLATHDETTLTFSTEDADKTGANGLEIGSAVWVYYTGTVSKEGDTSEAVATRVVQSETKSVTGTVNEGTSMNILLLDTDDGQKEFKLAGADTTGVDGLTAGTKVTVSYAENPDAPAAYQIVTQKVETAE